MIENLLLKLALSIGLVLAMSYVAERVSPKVAGIISGAPTGTLIILFLFGLDHGSAFASQSALYNLSGLSAMIAFFYTYFILSRKINPILCSFFAISAYSIVVLIQHFLELFVWAGISISIPLCILFGYFTKHIPNATIKKRITLSPRVLILRALCAASIILFVSTLSHYLGAELSGLLSAFPTTVFPLLIIIHFTYGKEAAQTILKNIPLGLGALFVYSFSVHYFFPLANVMVGTLIAIALSLLYLFFIAALTKKSA